MFQPDEKVSALKRYFESENIRGIAVDIDDTIADTGELFFDTVFATFGNPENLTAKAAIEKYGVSHYVPYWQTPEIKKFLQDLRRDIVLGGKIPPIAGALEALKELSSVAPCICYLTARRESVRADTEAWLKKYGFPEAPIIMRPDDIDEELLTVWKGPLLEYLYPNVLGIVDDNPKFTETVGNGYKGVLFLYGNVNLPDEQQSHVETVRCASWKEATAKIKTYVTKN